MPNLEPVGLMPLFSACQITAIPRENNGHQWEEYELHGIPAEPPQPDYVKVGTFVRREVAEFCAGALTGVAT